MRDYEQDLASYRQYLQSSGGRQPSTVSVYASNLLWLLKLLGTADPTQEHLNSVFSRIAQENPPRFGPVRSAWKLFAEMKGAKQTDVTLANAAPKAAVPALEKSSEPALVLPKLKRTDWILPEAVAQDIYFLLKESTLKAGDLEGLEWKDVGPTFEAVWAGPGLKRTLRFSRRSYVGCAERLARLRAWAEPSEENRPLIPTHPGAFLPFPAQYYFKVLGDDCKKKPAYTRGTRVSTLADGHFPEPETDDDVEPEADVVPDVDIDEDARAEGWNPSGAAEPGPVRRGDLFHDPFSAQAIESFGDDALTALHATEDGPEGST